MFVGGWAGSLGDFALCRKAVYVPLTWNEVSLNVVRSLLVTSNTLNLGGRIFSSFPSPNSGVTLSFSLFPSLNLDLFPKLLRDSA